MFIGKFALKTPRIALLHIRNNTGAADRSVKLSLKKQKPCSNIAVRLLFFVLYSIDCNEIK